MRRRARSVAERWWGVAWVLGSVVAGTVAVPVGSLGIDLAGRKSAPSLSTAPRGKYGLTVCLLALPIYIAVATRAVLVLVVALLTAVLGIISSLLLVCIIALLLLLVLGHAIAAAVGLAGGEGSCAGLEGRGGSMK